MDLNSQASKKSEAIFLPGLNGLRAISAIAVVIDHITLALGNFGLDSHIFGTNMFGEPKGLALSAYGVTIFFTLSGFLITFLLLKEKELRNLDYKKFYVRRILRIWPLYYLVFTLSILTAYFFQLKVDTCLIPFYLFLTANIPLVFQASLPFLTHYWSLGVEEQFYLFFPHIAKYSNAKLLRISIIFIFTFLLFKFLAWVVYRKYSIEVPFAFLSLTRFHVMLFGAVGAILYYNKNRMFLLVSTHWITQFFAWFGVFLMAINRFHIASVIDAELAAFIALALIMGQITVNNRLINLDNKVCEFLGKISFGMYVVHPLLIFYFSKILKGHIGKTVPFYLAVYTIVLSATILVSYISFTYFEKIFLNLKSKYLVLNTRSSRTA